MTVLIDKIIAINRSLDSYLIDPRQAKRPSVLESSVSFSAYAHKLLHNRLDMH